MSQSKLNVSPIRVNRGSDFNHSFNWKNPDKTNANLTGYTVNLMDVSPALVDHLAVTIPAPTVTTGVINIRIEWDDSLGPNTETKYQFRFQLSKAGSDDVSSNLFEVTYQ